MPTFVRASLRGRALSCSRGVFHLISTANPTAHVSVCRSCLSRSDGRTNFRETVCAIESRPPARLRTMARDADDHPPVHGSITVSLYKESNHNTWTGYRVWPNQYKGAKGTLLLGLVWYFLHGFSREPAAMPGWQAWQTDDAVRTLIRPAPRHC